ncbi:SOS response-associated peptidase [Paracoccus sp. KR1-242]|uniref:SOS response-associated peptidase n=1 Tax=Paracoccus sp. KR1-242 TaxID=3410028 RepID=UPI003BFB378C
MCNLYHSSTPQELMRRLFSRLSDRAVNLEPGDIYPDRLAPIIRHGEGEGWDLVKARWGMPSPPQFHSKSGRDSGVTNIRNVASPHWRRWLGPEHRCLVPVDRFSEPGADKRPVWFAPVDGAPMFFAGIETRGWTSIRKVKDDETTDDLFGFLTCQPNAEVGVIHPKAMPVILRTPGEWEAWMYAPWEIAKHLQRPLPDGALQLVDV